MNRHERLGALLNLIVDREQVHVDTVVAELGISPATVRRDLDTLADQQLVVRTRGGAAAHPSTGDLPLRYKATRSGGQKARIAAAAAAMVSPGQVVGLNGGTTTTEVARELAVSERLHSRESAHAVVVTNAVNIAAELAVRPHLRVVLTGGVVRPLSYELTGPLADLLLDQVSLDVLFLGVNAFGAEPGAASHDEGEAAIGAALAARAQRVVVVADASKLGRSAFARILGVDQVHTLITDDAADPEVVAALRAAGVEVVLV
ncbi:MAG TPA: DeoR/GlpR family DNA-binding transcription regulator [Candidatus Ruania gallistercoris]|uniref:DeoR/GlpR family DNA-binding transcription regulator n=1 Tax=Candidatus Ruania gallistercoris TaxID=2838746 RepID=A0A9D2J373_9MICO|nr:DeoR/GlpR family DNA-binding transcription regulator [Candidatus Ruania gallistercoris]